MIYTIMTEKAIKIAYTAHLNQTDKSGVPYFCHVFHVAEQFTDPVLVTVALLHDVIEDTDITARQLIEKGIPEEIVRSVETMTHKKHEPYEDYIERIALDPVATKVKLQDLYHNMDMTRMREDNVSDYDREKHLRKNEKYKKAFEYLSKIDAERSCSEIS